MNAHEWAALTEAPKAWAALAGRLGGGLEAVFDDAGRAGLAFRPAGAAAWTAFRRAAGSALPAALPAAAWVFVEKGRSAGAGARARPLPAWSGLGPVPELGAMLGDLHALHPLAAAGVAAGRLEARFAEPVPWPFFACLDASKPFAAGAAGWARRLGSRGVAGFAFGGGRMEIFVC